MSRLKKLAVAMSRRVQGGGILPHDDSIAIVVVSIIATHVLHYIQKSRILQTLT